MEYAPFLILGTLATAMVALCAYCITLGFLRNINPDEREEYKLVYQYMRGLYYGLWFFGWVALLTHVLWGGLLLVSWGSAYFGPWFN